MKHTAGICTYPESYKDFIKRHPSELQWSVLKNDTSSAYLDIKSALRLRQRGICAFCEIFLRDGDQQIEHWVPKSESTEELNWTYAIDNFHLSCENISKIHWFKHDALRGADPKPGPNASCGQAKENKPPSTPINGHLPLRPTDVPIQPPIFQVQKDGAIFVSVVGCNISGLSQQRAAATITYLNLDCTRLRNIRESIWVQLDEFFIESLDNGLTDDEALSELCDTTLILSSSGELPEFVTTLRSYFGELAEHKLNTINSWSVGA